MIRFHCSNCNYKVSVADEHAGKKGKCPKCKQVVTIPDEKEATNPLLAALDRPTNESLGTYEVAKDTKACPFCAEEILESAIKCKHCGSMLRSPQPVVNQSISMVRQDRPDTGDDKLMSRQVKSGVMKFFIVAFVVIVIFKGFRSMYNMGYFTRPSQSRTTSSDAGTSEFGEASGTELSIFLDNSRDLLRAARQVQSLNSVGGNIGEYKSAVSNLRVEYQSTWDQVFVSPMKDRDMPDTMKFMAAIDQALSEYTKGLDSWSKAINQQLFSERHEASRDRHFNTANETLNTALDTYGMIQVRARSAR